MPNLEYDESTVRTNFDRESARNIRSGEGITQIELIELLGFKGYTQLSAVESGSKKIAFPPQSGFVEHYLVWLKNHGYNPFGIK